MPVNGSDPVYPSDDGAICPTCIGKGLVPGNEDPLSSCPQCHACGVVAAPGMDIRTEATRGFMRDILRYQLENEDLYAFTLSPNAISPKEGALADALLSHAARLADRATDALIAELNKKPKEVPNGNDDQG